MFFVTFKASYLTALGFDFSNYDIADFDPATNTFTCDPNKWCIAPNPIALHNSPAKPCPSASPSPTPTPTPGSVVVTSKSLSSKNVKITIQNDTSTAQVLTGVSITWPQATNGNLNSIKYNGTTIYNTSTGGGSLTIPPPPLQGTNGPADDQRGCTRRLAVYVPEQRQHERRQLHWFGHVQPVWARYDPAIKSSARLNNEGPAKAGPFVCRINIARNEASVTRT